MWRHGYWLTTVVIGAGLAVAHPLDEDMVRHYVQVTVTPKALEVDCQIMYGGLIAHPAWLEVDSDGDGELSAPERQTWAEQLRAQLQVSLDDQPLRLQIEEATFPPYEEFLTCLEPLFLRLRTEVKDWGSEPHRLRLAYRPEERYRAKFGLVLLAPQGTKVTDLVRGNWEVTCTVQLPPTVGEISAPSPPPPLPPPFLTGEPSPDPLASQEAAQRRGPRTIPALALELTPRAPPRERVSSPFSPRKGSKERLKELLDREQLSLGFILFALAIAVLLGAAHALTPGHGKAIVAAYLVGSKGTLRDAVLLGTIVTLTHTSSVLLLGVVTLYLSQYVLPDRIMPWLGCLSGLLILGVGFWLFTRALTRGWGSSAAHGHAHGPYGFHVHGPEGAPNHLHPPEHPPEEHPPESHVPELHPETSSPPVGLAGLISLGISGGLVPCPDALVILLLAVALRRTAFGLLLILGFSLGLAAVLIALGVLMVTAKSFLDRWYERAAWVQRLPVASAVVIMVLGFLLTVQSLVRAGVISINL
ncbi:MAG TPA: hypothetical protein EYP85_14625 [Armatimonadetes bacterium]|nr:hypothetical protein [Armatimonadota bacterium]